MKVESCEPGAKGATVRFLEGDSGGRGERSVFAGFFVGGLAGEGLVWGRGKSIFSTQGHPPFLQK